jgi:predicted small lipoprotein YifL
MKKVLLITALLVLAGCGVKKPVLYPNAQLQKVGQAQAQLDIEDCCRRADAYIKSEPGKKIAKDAAKAGTIGAATGAAVGAVYSGAEYGGAGRGAAAGAAGGIVAATTSGIFESKEPSPVYQNFVNRCLHEKGYEPIGWQ